MTVVLLYLAVACAVAPRCIRTRYDRLRSSHPHTHPRDVRYDLTHAVRGGAWRACTWGPRAAWWAVQRVLVWLGLKAVGAHRVGQHLRAARVEMLEAELACFDGDEDLLVEVRTLRRRVEEQEAHVSRMLSA